MINQLKQSLDELNKSLKIQDDMVLELVKKLPEDKRKHANQLIRKAKAGKLNINEVLNFAGKISKKDKEDIENAVK